MADVADVSASSGDTPQGASGDPAYAHRRLDPTDEWLVGRLAESDPAALGELYDRYHRAAFSLARRLCSEETSIEILRDVFLAIWRDPALVEPSRGRFVARLLSLVHGRALQDADASKGRTSLVGSSAPDWVSRGTTRGVNAAGGASMAEQVASALDELPSESRQALALAYFGGYTQPEIASIVGESSRAVRSRMFTAVQRLRALLLPQRWEPGESVRTVR